MHFTTTSNKLAQILQIADYPGNREKVVTQFEQFNHVETLCALLEKLPKETQKELKNSKNLEELLKTYVDPDAYTIELNKIARKALNEYVDSIADLLTVLQKQKIAALLS